ncbi:MAG: hypothetical protein RJA44_728, partial [Pseudomonadota bacterium]
LAGWALLQTRAAPPRPDAAATLMVEMLDGPSSAATPVPALRTEVARPTATAAAPVAVSVAQPMRPAMPVAALSPVAPVVSVPAEQPLPPVRAAPPEPASPAAPATTPVAAPAALTAAAVAGAAPATAATGPATSAVEPPARPPAAVPAAPRQVVLSGSDWLRAPAYVYPRAAERLREEGTVQVRIHFDAQGVPREVELLRSSGSARLDQEVLAKARQSRAKPRLENGVPIEFRATAEAEFKF